MSRGRKPARGTRCPTCGEPTVETYRPFCSRRCADIDLGRWFRGQYRIPSAEPAPEDTEHVPDAGDDDDSPRH